MRILPVLATLLLAAIPVQATEIMVTMIEVPAAPLVPMSETGTVVVHTKLDCRSLAPDGGQLDYRLNMPAGIAVSGPMSQRLDPCSPADALMGRMSEQQQEFQVVLGRDLPGLEQLRSQVGVFFTPKAPFLPTTSHARSADTPFSLSADAYFLTEATAASRLVGCACEEAVFSVRIDNLGNSRTRYDFQLTAVDGPSDWSAQAPEPLVLDSPTTGLGASNGTVEVRVRMPSDGQQAYQLVVSPSAADVPDKLGPAVTVNLLAVRGLDEAGSLETSASQEVAELPLPVGPALALGLLAFAGLLRRRA